MLHVQVMDKLRDDFCVSFAFELVAALLEELLDVLVVCDDPIVNDNERVLDIGPLWMRVLLAGGTVSGPTSVRNA